MHGADVYFDDARAQDVRHKRCEQGSSPIQCLVSYACILSARAVSGCEMSFGRCCTVLGFNGGGFGRY
eukprot:2683259-Rhodomonas_salina.5